MNRPLWPRLSCLAPFLAAALLAACGLAEEGDDLASTEQELGSLSVTITSGPPSISNQSTAAFTYRASRSGASFYCRVDGAPFAPCSASGASFPVADGAHTFSVYAQRGRVRSAVATWSWTVDTTAPVVTITSAPSDPTNLTEATFTFVVSEPAVTACSLDGTAFVACASPVTYAGLAAGIHQLVLRATDAAGNTSTSNFVWTITP